MTGPGRTDAHRPHGGRAPGCAAWIAITPVLVWVAAFVVVPALIMVVYSLGRRGTLGGVVFDWTLEQYAALLDPIYLHVLIRSLVVAALTTAICLVLAYPSAVAIGRAPARWRNRLLLAVMVPFWTSFLIRTYAWVTILKGDGVLNTVVLRLRLITAPLDLLYTPGAVVLGLVSTFLPFMLLPIYSSVEQLDPALIDAALDLGAPPLRTWRTVVRPLTAPGVRAGILLVFVPAIGIYAINDVLGGGRVDMIGNIIEHQFQGAARNWPFGAAAGTALMIVFLAAFWLTARRDAARAR
jgi:spermidine/putrescine transport system permease protein